MDMAWDRTPTPKTYLFMPVGFTMKSMSEQVFQDAQKTMESFQLPSVDIGAPCNSWNERERYFFVRSDQSGFFKSLENEYWRMIVYPSTVGEHISDIRAQIKNFEVSPSSVIVNLDADFQKATDGVGCAWTATWHSDSEWVGKAMLALVRQFDNRSRVDGLLFAGIVDGAHAFRASYSSGVNVPSLRFNTQPSHFQEALTFETSERAGRYPEHLNFGEGLYRELTIQTEFQGTRRYPVGILDTFAWMFKRRKAGVFDAQKDEQLASFCKEFGEDIVLRKTYFKDGKKRYGFNQQFAGSSRNRRKGSI